MPSYRSRPKAPAKDTLDVVVGSSSAGPAQPGFGRVPSSPGERNALTRKGPGGHKSSRPHSVPPTWVRGEVAEDFNLPEKV
jgi:hypothetical protein